jgi:hypothetical protein
MCHSSSSAISTAEAYTKFFKYPQMKFSSEEFLGYNAYSLLKVSRHFGGMCHLHLQGGRISRATNQVASRGLLNDLARILCCKGMYHLFSFRNSESDVWGHALY